MYWFSRAQSGKHPSGLFFCGPGIRCCTWSEPELDRRELTSLQTCPDSQLKFVPSLLLDPEKTLKYHQKYGTKKNRKIETRRLKGGRAPRGQTR